MIPAAAAPAAQSGGSFRIRVEVDLVTVEVSVLDRHGTPVHGLQKENFRLYEDGRLQEIVSLDEVAEEDAPAPDSAGTDRDDRRGKTVLILFDDSTIASAHLKTARDAAERFIREHMRPFDHFAVAVYDQSLRILQGFTGDAEKALAAIRGLPVSSSGRRAPSAEPPPPESLLSSRPDIPDTRGSDSVARYHSESFFRTLESLSRSVERIRGCKSILLFSEDISLGNESRSLYLKALNSARKANVVFYTIDAKGLEANIVGEMRPPAGNTRRQPSPQAVSMSSGLLQGKGGGTGKGGTAAGSAKDDMRQNPWITNPGFESRAERIEKDVLKSFSSETGGFPIYNTANFDQELAKLDRQLSNYYILGFQSGNPKRDGSLREIEVETTSKDVSLRYRKSYIDRQPLDTLANTREEKSLRGAMESPGSAKKLPLVFRAIHFYETPRLARVLVSARIDMEKAKFKKKSGKLSCDLNVMGFAYADNGGVAARFSETVPVTLDIEGNQGLPKTFAYSNYFRLQPGKYRLKLAVSDGDNNLGATEQESVIPAPRESGVSTSSLVIAESVSHLPALIQNIEARLLDDNDPLAYAGMQISPSIENVFPVNTPLAVLFKFRDPAGGLDRWKASIRAKLVDAAGKERVLAPVSLESSSSQSRKGEATIACTLRFRDVEPGPYRLVVEAAGLHPSEAAIAETELKFVAK